MESGYTEVLLDLTSKKEVLVGRMHDRVTKFVEVRAEPQSLQAALLSSQDLIRQASPNFVANCCSIQNFCPKRRLHHLPRPHQIDAPKYRELQTQFSGLLSTKAP
jgi:hypothetical protein